MGNILSYPITANEPPDTIRYRNVNAHSRKRLLILGMMAASSKAASVPNIDLRGERMLKTKLRKAIRKYGKLKICKLSDFKLHQLRYVLKSLTSEIINKDDTNPIILDNGCSRSATGFRDDFVDGNIVWLCHTHLMKGIGASLEATHEVTLHYEVINYKGKVSVLEGAGLFMPDLKYRHLIPKDNFMDLQRLKNLEGSFTATWEKSVLNIYGQVHITINYEHKTHLHIMHD